MADDSDTKLTAAREKLRDLREKMKNLLQVWKPFLYVEKVIREYILFLFKANDNIFLSRSDLLIDLGILKGLLTKLVDEHKEAEEEFFNVNMSTVYAHKRRSMMLRELHGLLGKDIPDEFRQWIKRQLLDEDWERTLKSADAAERGLKKRAADEGGKLDEQTRNDEPIEDDKLDLFKVRFMEYQRELADAATKEDVNIRACAHIPGMCESIKKLVLYLEATCLTIPDVDVEGHKNSQEDAQEPIEAGESSKTSYKMTETEEGVEESQDGAGVNTICCKGG